MPKNVTSQESVHYTASNVYSKLSKEGVFSQNENINIGLYAFNEKEIYKPMSLMHQSTYSTNPYVCVECGRSYMYKYTLQRHMKLECGKEPNIQCPHCPYRTKRNEDLKKHMKRLHHQS